MASAAQSQPKNGISLDQGKTPEVDGSSDYRFPASRKVYTLGHLHPDVRVPHREISLSPTRDHLTGTLEKNAPLRVYDTSGPYTDPEARIDIAQGLVPLRGLWIRGRQGVSYAEVEPSYRPVVGPFRPQSAAASPSPRPSREWPGDPDAAGASRHYHA